MTDENEPGETAPAPPLTGARLLRAHPLTLVGVVLLTAVFVVAEMVVAGALGDSFVLVVLSPVLTVTALVGALSVVAVLAGRRVTPDRIVGLWLAAAGSWAAVWALGWAIDYYFTPAGGYSWVTPVYLIAAIGVYVLIGLLGAGLLPAVAPGGRRNLTVLTVTSFVLSVLPLPVRLVPGAWPLVLVYSVLVVGWAIAALVTSSAGIAGRPVHPR